MERSDIEKLLKKVMTKFVDEEVIPVAREHDESGEFPYDLFKKIAILDRNYVFFFINQYGITGKTADINTKEIH